MRRHICTLKKPAGWYKESWREALPLGNGLTGALITGAIGQESILFNRFDLWEDGADPPPPDVTDAFRAQRAALDRGDYAAANDDNLGRALREKGYETWCCGSPHPLGWLDIRFEPSALFRRYRRSVNLQTGEAVVEFTIDGCRYTRRAFVSRAADVTALRFSADRPFTQTFDFRLYNETAESATAPDGLYRASAGQYTAAGIRILGDYTAAVCGSSVRVTGTDYTLLVRCASHGSDCSTAQAAEKGYDALLAEHVALHRPLYDAVSIELADDAAHEATNEQLLADAYDEEASPALLERLWRFGRYLFISATHENGNPVPLYGLWHGDDHLAWSQYVANENVEQTYWHVMAGGLSWAIPPLLRYYTRKTESFRACARQVFGCAGIWISAYTSPIASGVSVPVSVISNWISCAGWLCRHFWEYYLYTRDETLLKDEILPFMHEAALFYRDYAVTENGQIRLYPSVSPENTPAGGAGVVTQNATMDFAVMKELLTNLLDGIAITGLYAEETDSFRALLDAIPPYQINADGAVKEWMRPELADNYAHRHLSHLYPVFPGSEISEQTQPALWQAFKKAAELRELGAQSGWSLAHMACIWARMGDAGRAVECLDGMAKGVVMDSLLTTHNDWRNMGTTIQWDGDAFMQLDAAFGAVNAVQELLFRRQADALHVLPALPARLRAGRVRGIVFPEGTADFRWDAAGAVELKITAARDLDTELLLAGKSRGRLCLSAGRTKEFRLQL